MPTRAPSAASPIAVALPMPAVPPVTRTDFPAMREESAMGSVLPRPPPEGGHNKAVTTVSGGWRAIRGGDGQDRKGGAASSLGRVAPDLTGSSALADAAALGLPALAGVLVGAQDGITVIDAERR